MDLDPDPSLGRYTQPDPLGFVDGPSVYAYARNSPQMFGDLDGRFGFLTGFGGVGASGPGIDASQGVARDLSGNTGRFASIGATFGLNFSSDFFVGVFSGDVCDLDGPGFNVTVHALGGSLTIFGSDNGLLGATIGIGPGAIGAGASIARTHTKVELFNKN